MDKLFILNAVFTAGFVVAAIIVAVPSMKSFLASFVGERKINIKRAEKIKRFIDEHKER